MKLGLRPRPLGIRVITNSCHAPRQATRIFIVVRPVTHGCCLAEEVIKSKNLEWRFFNMTRESDVELLTGFAVVSYEPLWRGLISSKLWGDIELATANPPSQDALINDEEVTGPEDTSIEWVLLVFRHFWRFLLASYCSSVRNFVRMTERERSVYNRSRTMTKMWKDMMNSFPNAHRSDTQQRSGHTTRANVLWVKKFEHLFVCRHNSLVLVSNFKVSADLTSHVQGQAHILWSSPEPSD
jgi:hypothetical protein